MRRFLLALALAAGCAGSQATATAEYVHATKQVVDTALVTYAALADTRIAACDAHSGVEAFVQCVGPFAQAHTVAGLAAQIRRAQEAFFDAYVTRDVVGIASALRELTQLVTQLREITQHTLK